jgi:hypothetical protein
MGWFSRLAGAKAKTAGEVAADAAASAAQQRMVDVKSFMEGKGGAPWLSGLLGEQAEGASQEREAALEGGMRGGQLTQFLTEQPFRRKQKVNALLSNLLQGTTQQAGELGQIAGTMGRNRQMQDLGMMSSLLGGFGSLGMSAMTPGGIGGMAPAAAGGTAGKSLLDRLMGR